MTNIEELKSISQLALIKEIIEKTNNCALIWDELATSRFQAIQGNYIFYLGRTSSTITSLDVVKNSKLYRTYNSSTQPEIEILFNTVDTLFANSTVAKYRNLSNFLGQILTCPPINYGVLGGGSAIVS